jgi:hypothetical protein
VRSLLEEWRRDSWRALVETVSARKWQVDRIDRASGLLTTNATEPNGAATMACATKYEGPSTVLTSIVAGKVVGGLRVTVNTTFVVARGHDVIACYTNGALEKELFEEIGRRLAESRTTK